MTNFTLNLKPTSRERRNDCAPGLKQSPRNRNSSDRSFDQRSGRGVGGHTAVCPSRTDDVEDFLSKSFDVFIELASVYGLKLSRYQVRMLKMRAVSKCRKELPEWTETNAMTLLKYRAAAFFSVHHGLELPPYPFLEDQSRVPVDLVSDAKSILGGVVRRWQRLTRMTDSPRFESFVASVNLGWKKGCPRPSMDVVEKGVRKTFNVLTHVVEPPKSLSWADMCDEPIQNNDVVSRTWFGEDWLKAEITRTAVEVFGNTKYSWFVKDNFMPSISANYIRSRKGMGAIGYIMEESGVKLDILDDRHVPVVHHQSNASEEESRSEIVSTPISIVDKQIGQRSFAKLYKDLLNKALLEEPNVELVGLSEAFKVRVISKGPPASQTVLKLLQKFLWQTMKTHKTFQLIGKPVDTLIVSSVIGPLFVPPCFRKEEKKVECPLKGDDEDGLTVGEEEKGHEVDLSTVEDNDTNKSKIKKENYNKGEQAEDPVTEHKDGGDEDFWPDGQEREKYASVDYSSATDLLYSKYSEFAVDAICDAAEVDSISRKLFKRLLTQHNIINPDDGTSKPQARGQLMGSIVSFPILCLLNATVCRAAIEVSRSVFKNKDGETGLRKRNAVLDLHQCPLLINGDDALLRLNRTGYENWQIIAKLCGFSPSIGKTFFTTRFGQINSMNFRAIKPRLEVVGEKERTIRFEVVPYVNMGLLYGQTRSSALGGKTKLADDTGSLGARMRSLLALAPDYTRQRLAARFMITHKELLSRAKLPWFLPEWMGGLGLVGVPSDDDIDYAKWASYAVPKLTERERPVSLNEPSSWQFSRFAEDLLLRKGVSEKILTEEESTKSRTVKAWLGTLSLFSYEKQNDVESLRKDVDPIAALKAAVKRNEKFVANNRVNVKTLKQIGALSLRANYRNFTKEEHMRLHYSEDGPGQHLAADKLVENIRSLPAPAKCDFFVVARQDVDFFDGAIPMAKQGFGESGIRDTRRSAHYSAVTRSFIMKKMDGVDGDPLIDSEMSKVENMVEEIVKTHNIQEEKLLRERLYDEADELARESREESSKAQAVLEYVRTMNIAVDDLATRSVTEKRVYLARLQREGRFKTQHLD